MKGLRLLATGGVLPGRVVTNEDLRRQVDTSDEWITTRTGIRQRYYCTENEDAATLAITAARQAMARSGLTANDISCCIVATLSAPTATPSIACRVQAALGLPEDRPAFDVNAACSGFIYAAATAHGLLTTLGGQYALVIGCEALSRMQTVLDRSQKTLSDLDWVVCHQANSRIIDHCVKHLHTEPSKFYKNMDRHGNTSAASIPIALHEMEESGLLRPGQTLACIGFGGGLTWGGMLLTYEGRK